jgi:hypothetical protein
MMPLFDKKFLSDKNNRQNFSYSWNSQRTPQVRKGIAEVWGVSRGVMARHLGKITWGLRTFGTGVKAESLK